MKIELWPNQVPFALGNGEEDRPGLTPYLVESDKPAPVMIVCPGGGYHGRAAHEGEPVAQWLNTLGVSVFILHYRVAPYRHPVPLTDAKRAIRMVRSRAGEWNLDPARVGILGFSAGGHLAASAGTLFDGGNPDDPDPIERESSRPDVMVLCYPVISMQEFAHQGSRRNLLGPDADEQLAAEMSIHRRVTEQTPPAFIWHTSDDPGVPVENSLMMATALSRHRVPFDLHTYMSGRHGLGLAGTHPEAVTWTDLCARFLRRLGFAERDEN